MFQGPEAIHKMLYVRKANIVKFGDTFLFVVAVLGLAGSTVDLTTRTESVRWCLLPSMLKYYRYACAINIFQAKASSNSWIQFYFHIFSLIPHSENSCKEIYCNAVYTRLGCLALVYVFKKIHTLIKRIE